MRIKSVLVVGACCVACSQEAGTSGNDQAGTSAGGGGAAATVGGSGPAAGASATLGGESGSSPVGTAGGDGSSGSGGVAGESVGGGGAAGMAGASVIGGGSPGGASGSAGTGGASPVISSDGDGDFMVGPTLTKSSDLTNKGAPAGKSFHFVMDSTKSDIFKGTDATLTAPKSFMRGVDVYVPAKYKDGTAAPFMVIQDGPGQLGNVKLALDNLTQSTDPTRRLPAFIAIAVANGGSDSIGSERGLEYDTMSDRYARFVQMEVLPAVLAEPAIKAAFPNLTLTADADGRASIGCSSGAAAALTMGWFRPEWFHRIVTYSGTFVAQQDPKSAEQATYPNGAWNYHSDLKLIETQPVKPLRIFINANQNDNGATAAASGRHNWLLANQLTAAALKARGYHYRFVEGLGASHCQGSVQDATLADTLVWVWRGYPVN